MGPDCYITDALEIIEGIFDVLSSRL